MGGDLGTLMCTKYSQARIKAFVNIEGDLTQNDRFMTDLAVEAHARGEKYFEKWLKHELADILFAGERARFILSKQRYQESLAACSAKAFWKNVEEIRSLNENLPGLKYAEAARLFADIQIPKLFCWGRQSIQSNSSTGKYLKTKPFPEQPFDAFHWIMLDQQIEFYNFLVRFLRRISPPQGARGHGRDGAGA
jgi:pimeloyl-ACP methyl ester carboxylesterase